MLTGDVPARASASVLLLCAGVNSQCLEENSMVFKRWRWRLAGAQACACPAVRCKIVMQGRIGAVRKSGEKLLTEKLHPREAQGGTRDPPREARLHTRAHISLSCMSNSRRARYLPAGVLVLSAVRALQP